MNRHRGFTFVEVLVGLLLVSFAFAILASSYLASIRNVAQGRKIHSSAFELRNEMEREVGTAQDQILKYSAGWDEATNQWKDGVEDKDKVPLPKKNEYVCCGMSITGYRIRATDAKNRVLHSFVAQKYREIIVPEAHDVALEIDGHTVDDLKFEYLEGKNKFALKGSYRKIEHSENLYQEQNKWYRSNRSVFSEGSLGNVLTNAAVLHETQDRAPRFSIDYTRLEGGGSGFTIDSSDAGFRDVIVRYSLTPLSFNKYAGSEKQSKGGVYFIGLPLPEHSLAKLKAHYHAEVVSGAGSGGWKDVRSYVSDIGLTDQNPFRLQPAQIATDNWGNYAVFDKTSSGAFEAKDKMTVFFRVRNVNGPGEKISLIQSKEPDLVEANIGKVQFDLSMDGKDLKLYTREVVKKQPPDIGVKWGDVQEYHLKDMETQSSYEEGYETDNRKGFHVLAVEFSDGKLKKIDQFIVKQVVGNDPSYEKTSILESEVAGFEKEIVMVGQKDFSEATPEGKMWISDVVAFDEISDIFEKKVGEYLVHRYLIKP